MDDNPWGQNATLSDSPTPPLRPVSPSPGLSTADSTGPDWDASSDIDDVPTSMVDLRPVADNHDHQEDVASDLAMRDDAEATADIIDHDTENQDAPLEVDTSITLEEPRESKVARVSTATEEDSAQLELLDETTAPTKPTLASTPTLAIEELDLGGPPMDVFAEDDFHDAKDGNEDTPGSEDDFDDFGDATNGADDDFGDFGDFDDAGADAFGDNADFVDAPAPMPQRPPPPVSTTSFTGYPPLKLDLSDKTHSGIAGQLKDFLQDIYPSALEAVSDEPERQVEGVGQVLVSEPLRSLLSNLSSIPPLRPLDWRRSRIRREVLITLGVPINLDDAAEAKPLASLVLPSVHPSPLLRSASPHLGPNQGSPRLSSPFSPISRTPTPFADRERSRMSNQAPSLDRARVDALCSIPTEDLTLMSLPRLQGLRDEIDQMTEEASGALTHALLMREKENGDTETYNNMIQDLVTAAAKVTSTSARASTPPVRASSGRWGR